MESLQMIGGVPKVKFTEEVKKKLVKWWAENKEDFLKKMKEPIKGFSGEIMVDYYHLEPKGLPERLEEYRKLPESIKETTATDSPEELQ